MMTHYGVKIYPKKPSGITLEQALSELNESSRIQSLYDMTVSRQATNLAIEALLFIQMSRITTPGSVPTTLHGEKLDE